eukprot:1152909-Pelagomonas_calceolata.AAC.1
MVTCRYSPVAGRGNTNKENRQERLRCNCTVKDCDEMQWDWLRDASTAPSPPSLRINQQRATKLARKLHAHSVQYAQKLTSTRRAILKSTSRVCSYHYIYHRQARQEGVATMHSHAPA